MKHTYRIKMSMIFFAMLSITCLAFAPSSAFADSVPMGDIMCACPGWHKPLGGASSCEEACGLSSGSSGSAPRYDAEAARRAQEAAEAAAIAEQQRQAEEDRIERERQAEKKRKKEAEAAAFISGRDATANTFRGSSDPAMSQLQGMRDAVNFGLRGSSFDTGSQLSGTNNSSLRGSSFDTGSRLKSAPATSSGDPMVVDARKVPSGLPKDVDNAIVRAYSNAPPGVSDRVRKGFQAVTARDWKVAKAWFQDALNRDPGNAGLKRLIALTDPKPTAPANGRQLQLPDDNDVLLLFPGSPDNMTAPANGTQLQLPDPDYDKDMWIVFPGLKGQTAPATGRQLQLPDENDVLLLYSTLPVSTQASSLQLPDDNDVLLLFPGNPEVQTAPAAGRELQLPSPNDMYLMFPDLEVMDEKEAQDLLFGLDPQPPTMKSRKTKSPNN